MDKRILKAFRPVSLKPQVTAAHVGISKRNWVACSAGTIAEAARQTMQQYGFDVLPVQASDGAVTGYYRTERLGDFTSPPTLHERIEAADCLAYQTELREVLERLTHGHKQGRPPFYFLAVPNVGGPLEVVGLVSDFNLNSRPVFQYCYEVLTDLEMELSNLIGAAFPDDHYLLVALKLMESKGQAAKPIEQSLAQYDNDARRNEQGSLREYLQLNTLLMLVEQTGLYTWLGYAPDKVEQFGRKRQEIIPVRNAIAHPVRSYTRVLRKNKQGEYVGLLATRLYTALKAATDLIQKLRMQRGNVDLTIARPLIGQYFTSLFFSTTQVGAARQPGAFCLEPGKPAPDHLPAGSRSVAYLTPHNPEPKKHSWQAADADANRNYLRELTAKLDEAGIRYQPAASQARPDTRFSRVREQQQAANDYREDGVWLLDVSREQAVGLGLAFRQDTIVFAQAGEMVQLLSCKSQQPKPADDLAAADS